MSMGMTMSIFFIGDPHGCFDEIVQVVKDRRPEAIVLLGDQTCEEPLDESLGDVPSETAIWWIHGNHDCDAERWHDHLFESGFADRNLNGRVVEIGGLRVAGLGGVFRGRYWHPDFDMRWSDRDDYLRRAGKGNRWRGGLPIKARCAIWREDYDRLSKARADILVTHEAPACHPYGFSAIDDLARAMGVSRVYHGHHHRDYQGRIGDDIQVRGVGLAGIADERGETILSGAFEDTSRDAKLDHAFHNAKAARNRHRER